MQKNKFAGYSESRARFGIYTTLMNYSYDERVDQIVRFLIDHPSEIEKATMDSYCLYFKIKPCENWLTVWNANKFYGYLSTAYWCKEIAHEERSWFAQATKQPIWDELRPSRKTMLDFFLKIEQPILQKMCQETSENPLFLANTLLSDYLKRKYENHPTNH